MGSDEMFQGHQKMSGSWVTDVAALMQEPDTSAIVMIVGALISLYNQVEALLEELQLKDVVAWKFQLDVRSFPPLISKVLPAVNRGQRRRLGRSLFHVVQLMCSVMEEARDALDDYFLATVSILHSSTLNRGLTNARQKIKHAVSLYHTHCNTNQSLHNSGSSSSRLTVRSLGTPRRRVYADRRRFDGPLRKVKHALLQLELTRYDVKPCPRKILKLVAKMRSERNTIYGPLECFTAEDFDHFCRVGGVDALVQLLNSPSHTIQAQALMKLESFMADDQTRLKMCVTPGSLEQLAAMVATTYGEVQQMALEVLRCLLGSKGHVDCTVRIRFPGIVESLLELLSSPSTKVQANAVGVLRELSLDDGTHISLAASPGAVEKLVKLFSSRCPTLQFCAAATLCNSCPNESIRAQAVHLPNVPSQLLCLLQVYEPWDLPPGSTPLARNRTDDVALSPGAAGWWVAMLDSELEHFQLRALDIMLSRFTETLMRIAVQEGILFALVRLLHSPSLSIQERAANALWTFSIPKEFEIKVARENGAVRRLVELLDSGSFSVRENACKVIESLSFNKQNRSRVVEEKGAIKKLSKLLFEDSFGVQANAASALWNLANTNTPNKAEVAKMGDTLERLVELLDSKSTLVQEKAAGALMNLSYNPEIRSRISAISRAVPGLVVLLQSRSTLVHQNAAGALYNLSADRETARTIAATPTAVRSLVRLLGSLSGIVQEYAAGAIANLSASEETRELCRQRGVVPMLVKLKSSPTTAARTQACRALDYYGSRALDCYGS